MNDHHLINEKMIVGSLKNGDFEAFDKLFLFYNKRLYHFALSILKNKEDARDVVQEVFFRVWKNRESIDREASFRSFLFTISYNIMVDTMRKKMSDQHFRDQLLKKALTNESLVDEEVDFNELNTNYQKAIEALPPQRRKIYKLHRFDNKKYEDIALELNLSIHTVRSQMSKALSFIRTRIGTKTLLALLFIYLYVYG